jgi:hypothetical protein
MGNLKIPPGKESCVSLVADKKIAFRGKQTSTLCLLNPRKLRVEKLLVDGCAITEGPRCDWAVEVNERDFHEEIFIELKGSHFTQAAKQLVRTIKKLSSDAARTKKRCLIAYTRCPMTGIEIRQLQQQFQHRYNARFKPVKSGSSHRL